MYILDRFLMVLLCIQVYTLTLQMAGVPSSTVLQLKPHLSNMLGLVRGNIYYNLSNWYRCLTCIPVGDSAKYMETMMGVKQVRGRREGGREGGRGGGGREGGGGGGVIGGS